MRSSTKSGQWTEPGKSQAPWRFSELRRLVSDPKTLKFDAQRLALLGHVSDLYELLRVIDETMPTDATLYVEGTNIAADIKVFLSHRSATVQQEVEAGTAGRSRGCFTFLSREPISRSGEPLQNTMPSPR